MTNCNCISCRKPIPKKLFLGLKLTYCGKEIGALCQDCIEQVEGFKLFLRKGKRNEEAPLILKEYQPVPNPH